MAENSLAFHRHRDDYRNRSLTEHHFLPSIINYDRCKLIHACLAWHTFPQTWRNKLWIKIPHADSNKYVYKVGARIILHWNRKEWWMNERGAAEFAWLLIVNVEPLATYSPPFPLTACARVFKSARFCTHCQKVKTSSTLVARHRHLSPRSTVMYACAFRFRGCILCQCYVCR